MANNIRQIIASFLIIFAGSTGGLGFIFPVYEVNAVVTMGATITNSSSSSNATSRTVSHTVDSGTNVLIIASACSTSCTTATFNGVSFTSYLEQGQGANPEFFFLVAPDVTTANIVVNHTTSDDWGITAWNFTGVDTSTPLEGGAVTEDESCTSAITTTTNSTFVLGMAGTNSSGATITADTGTRRLHASTTNFKFATADQPATTAGSNTQTFSKTSGTFRCIGVAVMAGAPEVIPVISNDIIIIIEE